MDVVTNSNRRVFLKSGVLGLLGLGVRQALGSATRAPITDLNALSQRVVFMRRCEWTDSAPRADRLRMATTFTRMTVHHAGAIVNCHGDRNTVTFDLQGVLESHVKRNYGDVGYHFVVDYVGRVWEGRSLRYEGAHVLGENERNIGVMLLGNFELQQPSEAQTQALAELSDFLMEQYDIRRQRIYGHCDLGQSLCPGKFLYPRVSKLRT